VASDCGKTDRVMKLHDLLLQRHGRVAKSGDTMAKSLLRHAAPDGPWLFLHLEAIGA
jgi:hypothetical protein